MDRDRYLCRGHPPPRAAGGLRLDTLIFCRRGGRRKGPGQDLTGETQKRGTAQSVRVGGVTGLVLRHTLSVETKGSFEGNADGADRCSARNSRA